MSPAHSSAGVPAAQVPPSQRAWHAGLVTLAVLSCLLCPMRGQAQNPSAAAAAPDDYQRGVASFQAGKIDEAIADFEKAVQAAPHDKALLNALGAAYSAKGDLTAARNQFLKSLDADPNFTTARENLGIALFSLGDYPEAALQFQTLLQQDSAAPQAPRLFLGMIEEKRGHCPEALDLLKGAGELAGQYPEAELALAQCAYQGGDSASAEEALRIFDRLPSASAVERRQAQELRARYDTSLAMPEVSRQPMPPAAMAKSERQAALLEQQGRLDEAQKILASAAEANPTPDLLMHLARVAQQRGDIPVALKSLKRVSELAPEREDSYLEFSRICADHSSDTVALQAVELGLERHPNSYELNVQKGVVLDKLGHLQEAETTLLAARGLSPDNSIALLSLAVVYAHESKIDLAQQTLADAITRFPDNYYMQYFRGKLLLQFSNNNDENNHLRNIAQTSLETAIRLNPEYADSYYQLSTLFTDSSPKAAEAALNQCLKLNPQHIPAQYALARLYIRTGKKAEGQALIDKMKTQQRTEELQQQKQLRIEVAQN